MQSPLSLTPPHELRLSFYDQNQLYFLTFQIANLVDVFTKNEYKQILVNNFDYCRKQTGLELYNYVVMTNHMHRIAWAKEPFPLSDIMRDFKKFTANELLSLLQKPQESCSDWMMKRFEFSARAHQQNSGFQFWTHENYAIELFMRQVTEQKLDYIHNNPMWTGIVEKAEDYLYSSTRNYARLRNMVEIDFL